MADGFPLLRCATLIVRPWGTFSREIQTLSWTTMKAMQMPAMKSTDPEPHKG